MKIQWKCWENLRHLHQPKKVSKDGLHKEQVKWPQKTLLEINYYTQEKHCPDNQIQSRLRCHCIKRSRNIEEVMAPVLKYLHLR